MYKLYYIIIYYLYTRAYSNKRAKFLVDGFVLLC